MTDAPSAADLAEARRIAETAVSDIWAATQKALAEDIAAALARVRREERDALKAEYSRLGDWMAAFGAGFERLGKQMDAAIRARAPATDGEEG